MKFNWGTGIFIFLVLFVVALISFVIFASSHEINLVHKDYYEKGVDYTEQMNVAERSKPFAQAFQTQITDKELVVKFDSALATKIDSGNILLYRPSTFKKDINIQFEKGTSEISISKEDLLHGRYILKLYWFSSGLKYEIDKPLNIQ